MAGSPPNSHTMDSRSACIQDVLKVKVKVKGHVIRALLYWHENRFLRITGIRGIIHYSRQLCNLLFLAFQYSSPGGSTTAGEVCYLRLPCFVMLPWGLLVILIIIVPRVKIIICCIRKDTLWSSLSLLNNYRPNDHIGMFVLCRTGTKDLWWLWEQLSVPADFCSNTASERHLAAGELYGAEPPRSMAKFLINFFLPRKHLPRVTK